MPADRRFALVCPNYHPRTCGVGDHSMRLAQELQRRGFESAIFTGAPAEVNPDAPEVAVTGVRGASPLFIARHISRKLDAFGPTDLIIQYTPQMFGAWRWGSAAIVWLAARERRLGVRIIVIAHELFLSWIRRPDLIVGAALMRLQFAALKAIAHSALVTVETRAPIVERLSRLAGLDPTTGVVRVGAGALPVTRSGRPGGLRIGTFSTLGRDKRFDVVLECFAIVHAQRPDAELIILGDLGNPQDARVKAFHDAVAAHPARERIRLLGKQDLETIAREVAALDVYLFSMDTGANTRSSTLPLALGTGLPVVAVRGPDTDGLFKDGDNVVFAERLSGESFARAVLRIAADPALAARLSDGASALYDHYLSWSRIGDQLLAQI